MEDISVKNTFFMNKYGEILSFEVSVKPLTTWKIGGIARFVFRPRNKRELIKIIGDLDIKNIRYTVVGNGSNILFGDNYLNMAIIYLGDNYSFYEFENGIGTFASGILLSKISRVAPNTAFCYLSYIPGTLGGALITNAEAHKVTLGSFVEEVTILKDGKIEKLSNEKCHFKYRKSIFSKMKNFVILEVTLNFKNREISSDAKDLRDQLQLFRKNKQPKGFNAGSVFKNPEEIPAGMLIEKMDLKGLRIGDAEISKVHGNFIVNRGEAKARDVLELIKIIKLKAYTEFAINLELEIIVVQ